MASLAVGPLVLAAAPRVVVAFHADGTVGHYALDSAPPPASAAPASEAGRAPGSSAPHASDPVAALIDPPPEALIAMEAKTASLMGRPETRLPPVRLYGPRKTVAGGPVLFRVDAEGQERAMRLYLDGARDAPYLVAAFDAAGAFLKSNIDYMGAEKVLELTFRPGSTYFFAVAFLAPAAPPSDESGASDSGRAEPPAARFVIAPKK